MKRLTVIIFTLVASIILFSELFITSQKNEQGQQEGLKKIEPDSLFKGYPKTHNFELGKELVVMSK